jgi:hypothetical protein
MAQELLDLTWIGSSMGQHRSAEMTQAMDSD